MDDRGFRKSKNVEIRRFRHAAGPPNPGIYPIEPWASETIANTQGPNQLADDLGRDEIPEAQRRIQQALNDRPASFDERFDGRGSIDSSSPVTEDGRTASASPLMSMPAGDRQQAIVRAAREQGIDPSAALAIAERESNFDPSARSSKTIRGMFQMRGDLRHQYGVGDSDDPYAQATGWGKFFKANKGEMSRVLGRDPTDAEGYLGHHFGSTRAARMLKMDPATPVDQVFTPNEMSLNPHFGKAGTVGALHSSVTADITKRQAKFGGAGAELPDFAEFGDPVDASNPREKIDMGSQAPDFSSFGTLASQGPDLPQPSAAAASSAPDFSSFGTLA